MLNNAGEHIADQELHHVLAPPSLTTWFEHFTSAEASHVHLAAEDDCDAEALAERLRLTGGSRFVLHSSHESLSRDARVASLLNDAGLSVVAQPEEAALFALDKGKMKEFFTRIGVRIPPSPAEAPAGTRDWVVKLRLGTMGRGMRFVSGPAPDCGADEYVEAFVSGLEFSVIAYVDEDRFVALPVVEKGWATPELRPPYRRARVCPPAPEHEAVVAEMIATTRHIARQGHMRGWLEVEFIVDCAGRHWALEINPRICGTMRLAAMCAQVAVFDIPAVKTLDGVLPAVAFGAEVPWEGEPIADPKRHRFATSRLTICAADTAELREELTALGIDLEAHTQLAGVRDYARRLRRGILTMVDGAKGGHPGSSLSAADAIAVLYHRLMRDGGDDPWERDRFFLSKGHAAPALYAALVLEGVLPHDVLGRLRALGSPLQGHPDPRFIPALEAPSGSLAQGASIAVGAALGLWRRGSLARVYALLGDGECQEGQIWEAAGFAAHQGLANLTFLIDRNGLQHDAAVDAIWGRTDLAEVWRAFGWDVFVVDGHNHEALEAALRGTPGTRPTAVIANTVKGKGVPFMENNIDWHSVHDPGRLAEALAHVGGPLT